LRLAVEWGITESAPKIKLLRGEHHRERVVLPEEEARYLAAAGELMADIATVLIDTGMRPEVNSRLRWESIGWSNGQCGTLQVSINIDYISEWLYQNRQLHWTRNGEVR